MVDINMFFSPEDAQEILSAIAGAESRTSGKIRVRVERKAGRDPLGRAREAFEGMGMRNAARHNGILFYVSTEDRKFAILGDDDIDIRVPDGFWNNIKDAVITKFKQKQFAIGIIGGINLVAEKLAEYFPDETGETKEKPDAISYEGGG